MLLVALSTFRVSSAPIFLSDSQPPRSSKTMRDLKGETKSPRSKTQKSSKLSNLLRSDLTVSSPSSDVSPRTSTNSGPTSPGYSSDRSNYNMSVDNFSSMSPWNAAASPYVKSPWTHNSAAIDPLSDGPSTGLVGSLIREEGHLYSLATFDDLLYTGSDSKNIRVWKNCMEFSGFKSGSGLVKAIVISGDKIFTGHQDGKIRIWKVSSKDPTIYKRVGTLPRLKDFLKSSINPSNYIEVRRHRNTVWLRHFDAVSCLSLDEDVGLLYSGSWDKTVKVWRISDSRCLESISAHDDAINSVAVGFDGLVFTGSADGTAKVWRREFNGKNGATKHVLTTVLLRQESAVTTLAVSHAAGVVYCGSSDGVINFWEKGRRLVHGGVLRGHKLAVLCLATAGSLVMSGSADGTIRVWRRDRAGAHTMISVLTGHTGPIKCLAVEKDRAYGGPNGPRWVLYSGSLDKSVKVWRVTEGAQDSHVMRTPGHVMSERHGPLVQEDGPRTRKWAA